MGRTILCNECHSTFDEDILKKKNSENKCLVCGASLVGENVDSDHMESPDKNSGQVVEKKTYYYYKEGGGTLDEMLFKGWKPLYTFQAMDVEDAKRQLKEICPNSPLLKTTPSKQIRCPRCLSTQFQLMPRKFSLLTGFATNKFDRVCVMCKKRF
ncbi:hypothetical protein D7V86_26675 [bacterium D16-51]|nr:hypothetical protein D7V96_24195 [bacterium D16-59]RKI51263.1 hypothetical protein D7V86_26675 [bacterium D16-51]